MEVKSYRDLLVWQKAIELTYLAYEVTAALPPDERFGLISQTRRASISIPANRSLQQRLEAKLPSP